MLNKLDRRFLTYLLRKLVNISVKEEFSQTSSTLVDCCNHIIEYLEGK